MLLAQIPTARRKAFKRQAKWAGALLLLTALLPVGLAHADGPFKALAGTWSGTGTVKLSSGATERLRCKGYYVDRDGGSGLGMAIRCASPANKFNLRANIASNAGKVSGDWVETNFNASGAVSGSASANKLALTIGGGITGTMAVTVSGRTQRVKFSSTDPNAFKGLNIRFTR